MAGTEEREREGREREGRERERCESEDRKKKKEVLLEGLSKGFHWRLGRRED